MLSMSQGKQKRIIPIFSSTSYFSVSAIAAAVSLFRVVIVVLLYSIRQSRSPFVFNAQA